jgi:hypothetical protein
MEYTFYFMIFRLLRPFPSSLSYFLPLDSNISLGSLFSKALLCYKFTSFWLCHILFGIIYFMGFEHCLLLNIIIPRFRDRCSVLIFIIAFKTKRGSKVIMEIIPKVILVSLLNLMNAKVYNLCSISRFVYVKNLQLLIAFLRLQCL